MSFIQKSNPLISLATPNTFPDLWTVLLDQVVPPFVKRRFSPKETWKNKPFSKDDLLFFSKGLLELSEFFTVDREGARLPAYFTNARFRSSYFLYFLPLQGAKFLALYEKFPLAVQAAIDHGTKTGTLKVIDVGSGPGTASIAFLIHLIDHFKSLPKDKPLPFKIQFQWIDRNATILEDGKLFLNDLLHFADSKLLDRWKDNIELITETRDWWKHPRNFDPRASLVVFGNVLNESPKESAIYKQGLLPFLEHPQGAGVLFVEPAFKSASQRLSHIRDELVLNLSDEESPYHIWGPCLHTQKCPLAEGRDWCHFSIPVKLPGKWFKQFSIKLGSVREWLKFSFVWIGEQKSAPTALEKNQSEERKKWLRVLSDPIQGKNGKENQVCTPERIQWIPYFQRPLFRGDLAPISALTPIRHTSHTGPRPRPAPRPSSKRRAQRK